MNKVMTSVFTLLAILLFWKSAELWHMDHRFQSNGVSITFMGWELRGDVAAEEIPAYARAFFVCGSVAVMTAFISLFRRTTHETEEVDTSVDIELERK